MEMPRPTSTSTTKQEGPRKCPVCGAIVPPFRTNCPDCGTDLCGGGSSNTIQQFANRLTELDERIADNNNLHISSSGKNGVSFWRALLGIMFFPFYIIVFILTLIKGSSFTPLEEQKKNYINTFPIPTSKEDLLEFMTLCQSNITTLSYMDLFNQQRRKCNDWNELWITKMGYIMQKSSIAMTSDKKSLSLVEEMYNKSNGTYVSNKKKLLLLTIALCVLLVAIIVLSQIN